MTTRGKVVTGAGLGLAALAGGLWYYQPERLKQVANIREIPAIRDSVGAVGQRMQKAEEQLQSWASDREGFRGQIEKLEKLLGEQKRQMRQMGDSILARVHVEQQQRDFRLNQRLAHWEAQREQDQAEITGLRRQVADLRKTVGQQQVRFAAMESNASADKKVLEEQVAGVRDSEEQSNGELRDLARSLQPTRIDFELTRNRSQELAPGVSIRVTGTDVAHRRVNGWMWIMPDRKTIWLRGQGAMQPVIYYSAADGKRREVVFTSVTHGGAVGYMLLPAEARQVAMVARNRE